MDGGCIRWHDELVIKLNNDEECLKPYFPDYPMYGCQLASLEENNVIFFRESPSIFSIIPPFNLRKEGCVHAGEQFRLLLVSSEAVFDIDGPINDKIDSGYELLANESNDLTGCCRIESIDDQGVDRVDYKTLGHEETQLSCKHKCSTLESCLAFEIYKGTCEIWFTKPNVECHQIILGQQGMPITVDEGHSLCEYKHVLASNSHRRSSPNFVSRRDVSSVTGRISSLFSLQTFI
eukprot:Awhi_evm1s3155